MKKVKAPRNRTLELTPKDRMNLGRRLLHLNHRLCAKKIVDTTICGDSLHVLDLLPAHAVDLVFADPPYNLAKKFGKVSFKTLDLDKYEEWTEAWVSKMARLLKPTASLYVCSEWCSSTAVHRVLNRHFRVRSRITWEREKGRGAHKNWKNVSEDIWFCTVSNAYTFNVEKVKLMRRVIAPYTAENGQPKDWQQEAAGRFRKTYPSNLWNDLTVPFWSMPENTPHPTQKPEKLLAKIILASSNEGDLVLDPFLGSGTTSVVCKKLKRHYIGIEIDEEYCLYAEKRLQMAASDAKIQGYSRGVFWERNTEYKTVSL